VCGTVHGLAVGLMLPHVIRFNAAGPEGNPYADLMPDAQSLAVRVDAMLRAGSLPRRLGDVGASPPQFPEMAQIAAKQWTATFNPRKVGEPEVLQMLESAS
jgi:alcohol dehydrogenase